MSENPNAPQHVNLEVVYSPAGEKFEMSPANARDVKRHAGWTSNKPHPDDVSAFVASQGLEAPAPVAEDNADDTSSDNNSENADDNADENSDNSDNNSDDENSDDNADENSDDDNSDENADGGNADENSDENADENSDDDAEDKVKTLAIHFADMDKDAVRVYIEETFPGTEIDGRWNRDKLVALSLELAASRA